MRSGQVDVTVMVILEGIMLQSAAGDVTLQRSAEDKTGQRPV